MSFRHLHPLLFHEAFVSRSFLLRFERFPPTCFVRADLRVGLAFLGTCAFHATPRASVRLPSAPTSHVSLANAHEAPRSARVVAHVLRARPRRTVASEPIPAPRVRNLSWRSRWKGGRSRDHVGRWIGRFFLLFLTSVSCRFSGPDRGDPPVSRSSRLDRDLRREISMGGGDDESRTENRHGTAVGSHPRERRNSPDGWWDGTNGTRRSAWTWTWRTDGWRERALRKACVHECVSTKERRP